MFNFFVGQDEPADMKAMNEKDDIEKDNKLESVTSISSDSDIKDKTLTDNVSDEKKDDIFIEQNVVNSITDMATDDGMTNKKQKKHRIYEEDEPDAHSKYAVMSVKNYFWTLFIMAIPVIGWFITLIWACGLCRNRNRRNLARATAIWIFIGLVFLLIAYFASKWFLIPNIDTILNGPQFQQFIQDLKNML